MRSDATDRNEGAILTIVSLRLTVGLLGERDARDGGLGFMSPTSAAFLTPVFGSKVLQARYRGRWLSRRGGCMTSILALGASSIRSACPRSWSRRIFRRRTVGRPADLGEAPFVPQRSEGDA